MTVQLDWPPDVVDRLTEEARQKGLSLDDYVLQTVLQQKAQNGSVVSDEESKRKAARGSRPEYSRTPQGQHSWPRPHHSRPY